jgi:DNA (cytosine-5)-methyltransferase 1
LTETNSIIHKSYSNILYNGVLGKLMNKTGVIDICCGMGGLSFAAQNVGLSICAGIDISPHAIDSFKINFPKALAIYSDISNEIVTKEIIKKIYPKNRDAKKFIIVSGPPCQGFSDAGPRCSDDPRNKILISVAKAIVRFKPNAAIVENVSALRKEKNSTIVNRFHEILNKSGFHIHCFELNALDFGVPQERRRVMYFIFPFRVTRDSIQVELNKYHQPPKTVRDVLDDLPVPPVRPFTYDPNKDNGILTNHFAMLHSEKVKNKIANIEPGKGPLSYRKLNPESYAATLISGHRAPPSHYEQLRSITVREALRLQGFPDNFRVMGIFSKQMEQVSNSVPVPLGNAVIGALNRLLEEYQ